MKYIYGPVRSRRLGLSLGISLTPFKVCSFNCIYCQLGATTQLCLERREYLKAQEVLQEAKAWFAQNQEAAGQLDYVTLSGSGEPTLNSGLAEVVSGLKAFSRAPVALITNASLLSDPALVAGLKEVDLLVPSLDAASQKVFERLDRPVQGVRIEDIIESLVALKGVFRGKVWVEVMLVKGFNDDLRQIKKLKDALERIDPDKIQLNSPVRSTAEPDVRPVEPGKLRKIRELLGEKAQII